MPNRGPSSPDSSATTTPGLRRVSSARVPGLPAHPSVNRRLSSIPSRSISSTLPALREPRSAGEAIDRRPSTLSPLTEDDTERAVPSPSKHLLSPDGADSGRSTMMSSPKASPPGVSESQQSATLPPARPSPRLTRSSVMERARAYDVSPGT
ncbi:hypothetical protein A0H81_10036 [Grifola frondosa]|uniref:Uncharacterized protein n=1 Tax=Grifola frondosa TaxID=5627 RepID=A0A1C7LZU7_GRIFR|nr:hypothetical protein A0H81_10036 [Grifola frondosa]